MISEQNRRKTQLSKYNNKVRKKKHSQKVTFNTAATDLWVFWEQRRKGD